MYAIVPEDRLTFAPTNRKFTRNNLYSKLIYSLDITYLKIPPKFRYLVRLRFAHTLTRVSIQQHRVIRI